MIQLRLHAAAFWGLLAGVVVFGALLAPVWVAPGHHLFGTTDDGLKNYYTALWYVLHDKGVLFTGMNYPFGEHVVFTDNQPLAAALLRAGRGESSADVTVARVIGTLNLMMLLAQVVSVPFMAALLRRCRLPVAYSVGAAVVIALLAPQLERLLRHYALGFSCVIPMLWYGLVRATEEPARAGRWWFGLGTFTLLLGCLHPYYLLVSALLTSAWLVVGWWQASPALRERRRFWLGGVATLVAPLVVFQLGLRLTDPYAADRLASPYGFFEYSTSVWSVFFPVDSPTRQWWQAVFRTPPPTWEGQAYVGLTATVVAVLTLGRIAQRLWARQWVRLRRPALPPPLGAGLWAATLVLLFAMGWPFRWGLEGLLEFLGPLRQFRSIGRFAWIFYYVFSVYAAHALYQGARVLRQHRRPALALLVLVVGGGLWLAEAVLNGFSKAGQLLHPARSERTLWAAATDPTAFPARLAAGRHRATAFQAIVPLPFYSLGSEKLGQLTSDRSGYYSMRASLETGLPIATAMLSRTALWQAQTLIQLLSAPALDKLAIRLLPNRRPLLLVVAQGARLDAAETRLLARARVFYQDTAVVLAELPLPALTGGRAALVARYDSVRPRLQSFGAYQALRAAPGTYLNGLDSADDPRAPQALRELPGLLGRGAHAIRRGELPLFEGVVSDTGVFEASAWTHLRTDGLPWLRLRTYDARTGRRRDSLDVPPNGATDILGDWLRLAAVIRVRQPVRLRVWLEGRRFVADAFCLRPLASDIWYTDPVSGRLVWNNYPLPPQPPQPAGWPASVRQ